MLLVGVPATFTERGGTLQLFWGLLVCFATFGAYMMYAPFIADSDDMLSQLAQLQIFLTLLSSLALSAVPPSKIVGDMVTAILFLVPLLGVALETPLLAELAFLSSKLKAGFARLFPNCKPPEFQVSDDDQPQPPPTLPGYWCKLVGLERAPEKNGSLVQIVVKDGKFYVDPAYDHVEVTCGDESFYARPMNLVPLVGSEKVAPFHEGRTPVAADEDQGRAAQDAVPAREAPAAPAPAPLTPDISPTTSPRANVQARKSVHVSYDDEDWGVTPAPAPLPAPSSGRSPNLNA